MARDLKTEKVGRRPTVGNLLYSLGRAFVAPSSSSPRCGLAPSGNDQGQARWTAAATRPRSWVRPRRANRAPRRWRQRVPVPLPSTPPFRLPASHPAARGDGPSALKQKTGPVGLRFPPLRGGASVFQLAPRCPPSASWGLRRRLRRGWTGEGRASLPPANVEPGPGRTGAIFVHRASARLFDAPAHQRGSELCQENNEIDRVAHHLY